MYIFSDLNRRVIEQISDMARPGVLSRVTIPMGAAEITNGMPLLRCLSLNDDAQDPHDVDLALMPRWVSWLICTIADNLDEPEYLSFSRSIADMLSQTAENDAVWDGLMLPFVQKMFLQAVDLITPIAAKLPALAAQCQMITDLLERAARNPLHALDLLRSKLGLMDGDLVDDEFLAPRVFALVDRRRRDVRNFTDITLAPFRYAVWGASLLAGGDKRARQMALDFDWNSFLVSQISTQHRDAHAGLDWVGLGKWLVLALQDGLNGRDLVEDVIQL